MAPHGMTPPDTGSSESPGCTDFCGNADSFSSSGHSPVNHGGDGDDGDDGDSGYDRDGDSAVATQTERQVKRPQLYKVLLHNDDYTTMEFVVLVLKNVFHHAEQAAVRIMLQVHQQSVGVAGVYSYEIAEARVAKVARLAKEHEFPLRCSMEPD